MKILKIAEGKSGECLHYPLLSRSDFAQLVFGNLYAQEVKNRLGNTIKLDPSPAKFARRGSDLESFWWVPSYNQEIQLDNVIHLMEYDINQEVYGLPEYLSALNSAWLNESATLFLHKYYLNGSHAGFILYVSDASQNQADIDSMRQQQRAGKLPQPVHVRAEWQERLDPDHSD